MVTAVDSSVASFPPAVKPLPIAQYVFSLMPSAFLRRVERHVFTACGTRFLAWCDLSGLYNVKNTLTGGFTGGMTADECDALVATLMEGETR